MHGQTMGHFSDFACLKIIQKLNHRRFYRERRVHLCWFIRIAIGIVQQEKLTGFYYYLYVVKNNQRALNIL